MRFYRFKKHLIAFGMRIEPSESWKQESRELLLAEIRTSPAWKEAPASVRSRARLSELFHALFAQALLKPALAGVLVFAVVSYSSVFTVQAAAASLPGDALYSVKLGIEAAHEAVTFSESKKAELEISFATSRIDEVNQILEQETPARSAPHIEQAIRRLSSNLDSVQKRLEKLGNQEESEEKVLKISALVNTATTQLAEDLLVIKERLTEQKTESESAAAEQGNVSQSAVAETDPEEQASSMQDQEPAGQTAGQDSSSETIATSTQAQAADATATLAASETSASADAKASDAAASANLLATLDSALDAVDKTNITSLEVFVGKAQTSKSEAVQQEAVDKVQKKIDTIEKNIDAAILEKAQSKEAVTDADTPQASSTQPVLTPQAEAAPSQIKEAINEAKKILDNKNISELGQVVDKVKEVKAIVKDAAASVEAEKQQNTEVQKSQDTKLEVPSISGTSTKAILTPNISLGDSDQTSTSAQEAFGSD